MSLVNRSPPFRFFDLYRSPSRSELAPSPEMFRPLVWAPQLTAVSERPWESSGGIAERAIRLPQAILSHPWFETQPRNVQSAHVLRERRLPTGGVPVWLVQLLVQFEDGSAKVFLVPLEARPDGTIGDATPREDVKAALFGELEVGWPSFGPDAVHVKEGTFWKRINRRAAVSICSAVEQVDAIRAALEGADNEWAGLREHTSKERFEFVLDQAHRLSPERGDALTVVFFQQVQKALIARSDKIKEFQEDLARRPKFTPVFYGYPQHIAVPDVAQEDCPSAFENLADFLDVIEELGFRSIELLPFFTSPRVDGGYDVKNFKEVDPLFGGDDAHAKFMAEIVRRRIRQIADLVANHVSSQHEVVEEAKAGNKEQLSKLIIWDDAFKIGEIDDQNIFMHLEKDAVSYVTQMFPHSNPDTLIRYVLPDGTVHYGFSTFMNPDQVDVDVTHPQMFEHHLEAMAHWANLGQMGTRMDAVPHVAKRPGSRNFDLPESRAFMALAKAFSSHVAPGSVLLPEANMPFEIARRGWLDPEKEFEGQVENTAGDMLLSFHTHRAAWDSILKVDKSEWLRCQNEMGELPPYKSLLNYLTLHDETQITDPELHRLLVADGATPFANGAVGDSAQTLLGNNARRLAMAQALIYASKGHPAVYYRTLADVGNDVSHYEENKRRRLELQAARDESPNEEKAADARDLDRGPISRGQYERAITERFSPLVMVRALNALWEKRSAVRTNRIF